MYLDIVPGINGLNIPIAQVLVVEDHRKELDLVLALVLVDLALVNLPKVKVVITFLALPVNGAIGPHGVLVQNLAVLEHHHVI